MSSSSNRSANKHKPAAGEAIPELPAAIGQEDGAAAASFLAARGTPDASPADEDQARPPELEISGPHVPLDDGYHSNRLDARLNLTQTNGAARLTRYLDQTQARLANGARVTTVKYAVLWLMEQLEHALGPPPEPGPRPSE